MTKRLLAVFSVGLALLSVLGSVSADWNGDAEVVTDNVNINMMEHLAVVVHNAGSAPIEVLSVAVTINWEGMPTLYKVFEGSTIIQPGDSREFVSAPIRMPNVALGTYSCFAGVVAKGADGVSVEHRYSSHITASQFSLAPSGVPEVLFLPLLLTSVSLLATFLLFRLERDSQWPYIQAVPRWKGHQFRRT